MTGAAGAAGALISAIRFPRIQRRIQGSACVTLGVNVGDVGTWFFIFWLCIDWFQSLNLLTEGFMKATLKTGMDALTVLRGQGDLESATPFNVSR